MNTWSEWIVAERHIRFYHEMCRILDICEKSQNELVYNLKEFNDTKVYQIEQDNVIIYVAYQLLHDGIISREFYKKLLGTPYEHASFQLIEYLAQKNYFSWDTEITSRLNSYVDFYIENGWSISTTQSTKKNTIKILEKPDLNWLLGEVEDIIELTTNILKRSKQNDAIKWIETPSYIIDLLKKMYLTKIITAIQYNILQENFKNKESLFHFVTLFIFFLLNTWKLDDDEWIHQSACIYLKLVSMRMQVEKRKKLSSHVGKIMEKYTEKKYLEKKKKNEQLLRKKVYTWFLGNPKNYAIKNIVEVYQFLTDLENLWHISSEQHISVLKEGDISIMLALWILFSLESGEYENDWDIMTLLWTLSDFFNNRWFYEECERVQCCIENISK